MGKIVSFNNENVVNIKSPKIIKTEYFSSINQILRYNYEQGFNESRLTNNMNICLQRKCFDEIYDNEENINSPYIFWLDYLYNYLSVEQSDKEWADEMLRKLDEEPFLNENKYLSHFFYKEFLLNTEPNCIKNSKDDDNSNNDINEEMGNNDIISMDNSNMIRNLGGSFTGNANIDIDSNSSNHESDNDIEKKYKYLRKKVKKYIYIFKQHIVHKDHPINKVIQIFEQSWVKYVEKKMKFIYNFDDNENDNYNINYIIDELTRELQNFVIKMQICLKLFYCRTINFACFINEKDELINLTTTLIFKTGKIYDTIFKLQQIKLKSNLDDMEYKYNQLKEITPQQLGIEKQFCLNEETFNMQEEILEKKEKEYNKNIGNKEEELNNIDLNNNGVTQFYLTETDEIMNKRKIPSVLADIKNKKIKLKKFNQQDTNNLKVNIDFDHDNNNLLFTQSFNNVNGSLFDENNMGSILPQSRGSLVTDKNSINNDNRLTKYENNSNNRYANELFDEQNDNNLIVREYVDGRKTLAPINFVKIFNRVSFWKDPDKSGEFVSLPYETAIQLLKEIQKYKAPFEKMLIFASLGNEIKNCIDDFWKDMEEYFNPDLLGIEAEQLMTIFIYIIIKAQIKDILVHCKLIQLFSTSMIKSSMIGYYYSNAEASVTFIQSLKNVKELYKGKNRIFDSTDSINIIN